MLAENQVRAQGLKERVSSGVLWATIGRIAQQMVQFTLTVVLARLLSPHEYGLMAMAMVFTGFAGMLAEAGFNAALVQRKELSEAHIHTVFWITLSSGVLLAGITIALSPWLAEFFKAPTLKLIFPVIALNFIFGGIGNVPSALLQRRMQFRAIAKIDVSALVISGIVGVMMALGGAGVWSLVAQSLTSSLLIGAFRCWSVRWLPKLIFSWTALKDIWAFTGHLYGFNFINYWARNADNLLIGKFFGAPALGAYSRAYALMLLPITQVSSVVTQVIFPAFSSIQDDKPRVKRIYLRAIGIVTLVTFPIMFGLAVVAQPFVETLYGSKWNEVSPLLQILALVGAMQVLINSSGWIFLSQGRTDVLLRWGICLALLVVTSFVVGVILGSVREMALCYAIANGLFLFPGMAVVARLIDMELTELLLAVMGPFFSSLVMAVTVAAVRLTLPSSLPTWQSLVALVLVGMASYATILYFVRLSAWRDLVQLIGEKFRIPMRNPAV